jgi:hypothetical protein
MALEAWGHRRIESGESVDKVLADVIGTANPPAAYLLVAVDLLLSHWPKSRVAAITESGSQRRSRLRQLSGRDSCQTWLG